MRLRRRWRPAGAVAVLLPLVAAGVTLSSCADYVVLHPTPTPEVAPMPSLPPIGYNHRYGNNPVSSADGLALERLLFSEQAYWEVGLRTDPQLAGFVNRADAAAVTRARAAVTDLVVSIATERIHTIQGMLAFPNDAAQEQYCIAILDKLRSDGYTHITKITMLVFFTEADEHALLSWTPQSGYSYTVNDGDLKGNSILPAGTVTPLPMPS